MGRLGGDSVSMFLPSWNRRLTSPHTDHGNLFKHAVYMFPPWSCGAALNARVRHSVQGTSSVYACVLLGTGHVEENANGMAGANPNDCKAGIIRGVVAFSSRLAVMVSFTSGRQACQSAWW